MMELSALRHATMTARAPKHGLNDTATDDHSATLPLETSARRLAADPTNALTCFAPPPEALIELSARDDLPDSHDPAAPSMAFGARAFAALPEDAPEWMRAARVMADGLEESIARGNVDEVERAAIERAWYAWTLGGATPRQVLKTAHLVRRAHQVIQSSAASASEAAMRDAAEVLHANLPLAVRQTLPFERVLWVVRRLRDQPDPWVAVVEGAAELLGWKDYARVYAANVIRAVIQQK